MDTPGKSSPFSLRLKEFLNSFLCCFSENTLLSSHLLGLHIKSKYHIFSLPLNDSSDPQTNSYEEGLKS